MLPLLLPCKNFPYTAANIDRNRWNWAGKVHQDKKPLYHLPQILRFDPFSRRIHTLSNFSNLARSLTFLSIIEWATSQRPECKDCN